MGELGVTWFEEPVSSDDLEGLREIRDLIDIDVAAGEYGYDLVYFERMCAAGAVDCLQIDVTRCAGITEWLRVASSTTGPLSAHCAPSAHVHAATVPANLKGQPGIFVSAAEWKERGYIMNDEARAKNLPGWREWFTANIVKK